MTYRDRFKDDHGGQNPPKHPCPSACGCEQDDYACGGMASCRVCRDREIPTEEGQ